MAIALTTCYFQPSKSASYRTTILLGNDLIRQFDFSLILTDIQRQSAARMPGDMAVQNPLTRVVRLEGNSHVPAERQQDDVTARRVIVVECPIREIVRVERTALLRKEDEVVAVQMHRMRDGDERASVLVVPRSHALS